MCQIRRCATIFFNKTLALSLFIQLIFNVICLNPVHAQSSIQKFDDRVMIDIQSTGKPEKIEFMLFMSNTYRYEEVGAYVYKKIKLIVSELSYFKLKVYLM